MVTAKMNILGEIDVSGPDGIEKYQLAMLITFQTPEDARKAMKDGECKLEFGL